MKVIAQYVVFALACWMPQPPLESLFGGWLKGPFRTRATSAANQFAGRTTIASGTATVVISTSIVNSDSLIFLGLEGNANVASGTGKTLEVKTISSGGYFTLGTQDGIGFGGSRILMWEVRRTS